MLPDGRVHRVDRAELIGAAAAASPTSRRSSPSAAARAARIEALFEALALPATGTAVVVAGDGFASEPVPLPVLRQGVLLHSLDDAPLPASRADRSGC